MRAIRPLVHVVTGLKLALIWFIDHGDGGQPFDGRHPEPVRNDQPKRGTMVGTQGLTVHLVRDQDLGGRIGGVAERQ